MNFKITRATGLLLATLALTTPVFGHGVTAGAIEIIHPNIPQPAEKAMAGAAYMGISNDGDTADRLIGVEIAIAAQATIHQTLVTAEGVASMTPMAAIDLPAHDTVVLEPGGFHIMLMGLKAPLVEGQMVPATLIFEHAGRVEMEFMVDPPGGMDHSTMDHGAPAASE